MIPLDPLHDFTTKKTNPPLRRWVSTGLGANTAKCMQSACALPVGSVGHFNVEVALPVALAVLVCPLCARGGACTVTQAQTGISCRHVTTRLSAGHGAHMTHWQNPRALPGALSGLSPMSPSGPHVRWHVHWQIPS